MSEPESSGSLSVRRAALLGVMLLGAVFALSVGVGFAAEGEGFNWETASVFGTALGTTLLAVGTLALAYSTWQDVRASQRIAKATSRTLELAEEERKDRLSPAVIGSTVGVQTDPKGVLLRIELHSIGGGPATRIKVTAEYIPDRSVKVERMTLPYIATGSMREVALRVEGLQTAETYDFQVKGEYYDVHANPSKDRILDWQTGVALIGNLPVGKPLRIGKGKAR